MRCGKRERRCGAKHIYNKIDFYWKESFKQTFMPIIVISMHLVLASYLTPVFSSYSCPVIHVSCLPSNIFTHNELYLVGGFNPSEHISQWEGLSHILWKIKNDPNHQLAKHHITISSLNRFSADQFALVFFIRVAPLQMVLSGHGRYNGIQRKCSNGP